MQVKELNDGKADWDFYVGFSCPKNVEGQTCPRSKGVCSAGSLFYLTVTQNNDPGTSTVQMYSGFFLIQPTNAQC